jgi:hypothetical protein
MSKIQKVLSHWSKITKTVWKEAQKFFSRFSEKRVKEQNYDDEKFALWSTM